ncbi:hypothetical protein ACPXCG_14380 [Gordonia sp. DT218]|uniref:hypothetical protein n=1 Tax=Gordonia sp. DT218 TaxID=3416659 RepID=UPI003CF2D2B8
MLILTGVGGALRSGLVVLAAIALGRERFLSRGVNLIAQAALQSVSLWLLLEVGVGVAAIPTSMLVSGLPLLAWYLRDFTRTEDARSSGELAMNDSAIASIDFAAEIKRFATTRGAAATISLGFTQFDRWIVAVNSTSTFLANYDLAARFAVIPKTALLTLGLGFVHEATRDLRTRGIENLAKRSNRIGIGITGAGCIGALALSFLFVRISNVNGLGVFFCLLVVLLICNSVHAMTAPPVLILTGMGKPEYELVYLVPSAITGVIGIVVSLYYSSAWGVTLSIWLSLAAWSAIFISVAPRLIRHEGTTRHRELAE